MLYCDLVEVTFFTLQQEEESALRLLIWDF